MNTKFNTAYRLLVLGKLVAPLKTTDGVFKHDSGRAQEVFSNQQALVPAGINLHYITSPVLRFRKRHHIDHASALLTESLTPRTNEM